MIGSWLKRRREARAAAAALYQAAAVQSRDAVFYTKFGVADTLDGRFDIVCLHVFLVLERLAAVENAAAARRLSQELFDQMFRQMDLTLREMGIGDMGIPKHMKRMMKAFNGRAYSYHEALTRRDRSAVELVAARNIYRTQDGVAPPREAALMADYIIAQYENLSRHADEAVLSGRVSFATDDVDAGERAA